MASVRKVSPIDGVVAVGVPDPTSPPHDAMRPVVTSSDPPMRRILRRVGGGNIACGEPLGIKGSLFTRGRRRTGVALNVDRVSLAFFG
jgi:hypothetical protein